MKSCIDFYDDSASVWADDWYANEQLLPYLKKLLEYINKKSPRVLDLCCGSGYESMRLSRLGANVVGVDLSKKSLQIAKERNPDIAFYEKDMLKSYSDLGKFDGIACVAGIVHLQESELEMAFKNMYEVSNDNAYLLLVFKEGVDEKLTSTFNNEVYARNFVFHTKERVDKSIQNYFTFVEDLPSIEETDWKYHIYKRVKK